MGVLMACFALALCRLSENAMRTYKAVALKETKLWRKYGFAKLVNDNWNSTLVFNSLARYLTEHTFVQKRCTPSSSNESFFFCPRDDLELFNRFPSRCTT